jgi:uncharacterized membrane protein HdeD (DUF308 family)
MEKGSAEIIYQQRYETFRHLDRLRWQMLQIGVAAGTILAAVAGGANIQSRWWIWLVIGLVLLLNGLAMEQIGNGIRKNSDVLLEAASAIGDTGIPKPSPWYSSRAFWIAGTMILSGLVGLIRAAFLIFQPGA